jgi:hypothetical protein
MREPAVRAQDPVCINIQSELLSLPCSGKGTGTGPLGIHLANEDRVIAIAKQQQVLALEELPCGQCCSGVPYHVPFQDRLDIPAVQTKRGQSQAIVLSLPCVPCVQRQGAES